jgi:hypothetical protein
MERGEKRREEGLVGVTVGQHEPPDSLRVARDDKLADGPTCVVTDQRHVAQIECTHQVGDDSGHTRRRHVHLGPHRDRMPAEREVGHDATETSRKTRHHVPPEGAVDQDTVHEEEHGALPDVAVADHPPTCPCLSYFLLYATALHESLLS